MKGYTMQYYILQKLNEDYFSVEKVRKPINTFDEAVRKVNALKTLDDDATTYIITQQVGIDDKE
jgi:biotin operon repressor